jgi:hypothetical protein
MILASGVLCIAIVAIGDPAPVQADRLTDATQVSNRIDELVQQHWQSAKVTPAESCDDATFIRRVTLDLAGRIPTVREAQAFIDDTSNDKRTTAIRRLIDSPEFALHLGNILDEMLQEKYAGEADFIAWLRDGLEEHKTWDRIFRELLMGPWDTPEKKRADRFLAKRMKNIDELTNDASRIFFGVDISCAKCHNHPLADDWKQDHYYGMSSFFNRTVEFKGKDRQQIGEKDAGDVQFVDQEGKQRTAQVMFLSGKVVNEPTKDDAERKKRQEQARKEGKSQPPAFSRRAEFVESALTDKKFFSRSLANRVWGFLLGRGLVYPVDQMHSANPPSVAGVLEYLADDLVEHSYDLERLLAGICGSRVYQLSSVWPREITRPAADQFAFAPLRPLTPKQYALSMLLATGNDNYDESLDKSSTEKPRKSRFLEIESQAKPLTVALDARADEFQSSTTEALFMSNNKAVQALLSAEGNNLTARLEKTIDTQDLIKTAVWAVLGRECEPDEFTHLTHWVESQKDGRSAACRDLVWALCTSAEFRFNH